MQVRSILDPVNSILGTRLSTTEIAGLGQKVHSSFLQANDKWHRRLYYVITKNSTDKMIPGLTLSFWINLVFTCKTETLGSIGFNLTIQVPQSRDA